MWYMRWQRLSISETVAAGDWQRALRRLVPSAAVASFLLVGAILLLAAPPGPLEAEEIVEGGDTVDVANGGRGMPATNPRVKSMVASHPGEFVTACVAGCGGRPSIVQILPGPRQQRLAEMVPTSGRTGRRGGYQANPQYAGPGSDDVVCMAGCGGRPGQIVQRIPGLPPLPAPAAGDNEPLDIGR